MSNLNAIIATVWIAVGLAACTQEATVVPCTFEGEEVPIADAKLIIEYNATDADIGVHGLFDDGGWSELCVFAPNGDLVLNVRPQAQLGTLTMAGIFFESREPPEEEFGFPELEAAFPAGEYEVRGQAFDGTIYTGSATFTHAVPAPPTITQPPIVADFESEDPPVVPVEPLMVSWEKVTETVAGGAVTITGYQVIVTREEFTDDNGFSRPVFDVHLPPNRTALTVSPEFVEAGALYEIEVLALEESGNQTISVGFFRTE